MQHRSSGSLSTRIGTLTLENPIGVASGTFGYGSEYEKLIDLRSVGALFAKSVTAEPRVGNEIPRLIETPSGLLNSIGLANVGIERYLQEKIPLFAELPCPVFANIAGGSIDEYVGLVCRLDPYEEIAGFEINLSCPNVEDGLAFGTEPGNVERLTEAVRRESAKTIVIKLTPNVTDICEIAKAAEGGGADGVTCINTLIGMVIDIERRRPVLPAETGGLSGPSIRPVGVAAVYRVSNCVAIPVVGAGGIMTWEDAVEYLLAGASMVQVGTSNFVNPDSVKEILAGVERYAEQHGLTSVDDFHGLLSN